MMSSNASPNTVSAIPLFIMNICAAILNLFVTLGLYITRNEFQWQKILLPAKSLITLRSLQLV